MREHLDSAGRRRQHGLPDPAPRVDSTFITAASRRATAAPAVAQRSALDAKQPAPRARTARPAGASADDVDETRYSIHAIFFGEPMFNAESGRHCPYL